MNLKNKSCLVRIIVLLLAVMIVAVTDDAAYCIDSSANYDRSLNGFDFQSYGYSNPLDNIKSLVLQQPFYSSHYFSGMNHAGIDLMVGAGAQVKSICTGGVVEKKDYSDNRNIGRSKYSSYYNSRVIVRCDNNFLAVYGHIDGAATVGTRVNSGDSIATIAAAYSKSDDRDSGNDHLHFGVNVHDAITYITGVWGFGTGPETATRKEVEDKGFRDPYEYISSNPLTKISTVNKYTGQLTISGASFGSTSGSVVVTIPYSDSYKTLFEQKFPYQSFASTATVTFNALILNGGWSDKNININIFSDALKWNNFMSPIKIGVFKSDGTEVADISYPFPDIDNTVNSCAAIHNLWRLGIANGKSDGRYDRDAKVTRAELLVMLLRAKPGSILINPIVPSSSFYDVSPFDWYAPYTEYAYSQGFVKGGQCLFLPSSICFRPDDPITRYEASIMATNVFGLTYWDANNRPKWTDYKESQHSYAPWIAYTHKVMNGYDTFRLGPDAPLTREQAAYIVNKIMSVNKP